MATDREKSTSKTPPPQKYAFPSNNNNHKSPKPPALKNKKNNRGQSKLMTKIGKIFVLLILPVTFGVALYHIHMNYFYLPSIVHTPSKLPKILNKNYFSNVSSDAGEYFWGTYRSLCYLGIRARVPTSPVFGLIWYTQPSMNVIMPDVRHWCSQSDKMKRYGWMEHDGKTFGVQEIVDDDLLIKTSFVKRPGCCHGGDWSFRVEAETTNPLENDTTYAFIVYVAMDPVSNEGFLKPSIKSGKYITKIDGQHPDLGSFSLKFGKASNTVMRNFMAADAVDFAVLKEATITGTGFGQYNGGNDASTASFYMQLMGYVPRDHPPTQNPRFLANQYTVIGSTKFDIVYESDSFKRSSKLTGNIFDQELQKRIEEFNRKFEDTFKLKEKMQADVYIEVGKHALSNMLGSMGYFHGSSKVASQYTPQPVPYGPLTLFSTVPSRSFFPRGFLWDEGFHQLLVFQWNSNLTLEIIGSWLDLMNVEGWIPREVILGSESEARVPAEFVVQQDKVANPPMFFYIIRMMLDRMTDKSINKEEIEATQIGLRKFYPRLKAWYSWLNSSQSGLIPGTYRWRGRNGTTERELNPKTLPSGLDDYPRASHPDEREYHIDLYSWMAFSSKVMVDLAKLFQDKESLPAYEYISNMLNDENHLNMLHWSQKKGSYCDYGFHTKNTKLERAPLEPLADGSPNPASPHMRRVVSVEPKLRLVSDTFGYVSLFPLFLRLIPYNSPKLGIVLASLKDEDLIWTPYGLRSLAITSPLYGVRNTEHDPPYWRGAIWINMNYLALSSLHYYSRLDGPHRQTAFEIYASLRNNLITNIVKEYKRTGYLWEHYDDSTGQGEGSHPFTGWTSLLLLMMSEQYQ